MVNLHDSVNKISGIGDRSEYLLNKLNIYTVKDLLWHVPVRYEDKSNLIFISQIPLSTESKASVEGTVTKIENIFTRNGKRLTRANVEDSTGIAELLWFNQHYIKNAIPVGTKISVFGKVDKTNKKPVFVSPDFEKISSKNSNLNKIVPIYPQTEGLTSKWLRTKIAIALDNTIITETLPADILNTHNLMPIKKALEEVHFPDDQLSASRAKTRLSFEEFLFIHLKGLYLRKKWESIKNGHQIFVVKSQIEDFKMTLPFKLTSSQERAANELLVDLNAKYPANRMLQGDVGSGKTVVALIALYAALLNKYNCIYLAPTQILAKQHFNTFSRLLNHVRADIHLIVSDLKAKPTIDTTIPYIAVGTHAILHHLDYFSEIGLIVIDEQHKFGVEQRSEVINYYSDNFVPNLLTMTATPIPRSIALTLYGDLELSVIDEMPKERKVVKTYLVNEEKRLASYEWMKSLMKKDDIQSIIVCPFIDESEHEEFKNVKAAQIEYENIKREFRDFKVGLLHGKLKDKEKNEIIDNFQKKLIDILVTTPVIEVGVDIPNANIIFIETAERFGLASLHQLRGRVGRGDKQGYCILMSSSNESTRRLKYLETIYQGQKLAEIDFKLRGPGNIYGKEQHGTIDLKVGDFTDIALIKKAKSAAISIINGKIMPTQAIKEYIDSISKIEKN